MRLSREDLWRRLLANGVNSRDIHRRPTSFLRLSYQQRHHRLELNGNGKGWIKEGCRTRKILWAGNGFIKLLAANTCYPSRKREDQGWSQDPEARDLSHGELFPGPWNLMKFAEVDFKSAWVWWLVFSFHFLPIVMGMSVIAILCLNHHCI